MATFNSTWQGGHMFPTYGSLPCYTLKRDELLQQAARGEYTSYRDRDDPVSLCNRLPFDTHWGRPDLIHPQSTFVNWQYSAPFLQRLPSDYVPLPYVLQSENVTALDFLRYQAAKNRQ